jgi:hypothetical protein
MRHDYLPANGHMYSMLVNILEHIINSVYNGGYHQQANQKHQVMKLGFNEGVQSVNVDPSVAESGTRVARLDDMFRD